MMTLTHRERFCATHVLHRLPNWHRCARMHGHTWTVTVAVTKDADLTDEESAHLRVAFAEFGTWVRSTLDHKHLNEVDDELYDRPSEPDLARWIQRQWTDRLGFPTVVSVSASASMTTAAYPG